MDSSSRVFVAGHRGLVGSAVVRRLEQLGFENILTATRDQLDLRDQAAVNYWFRANRPEFVYLVAGTVGGIMANSTRPAEFIYDNMMIHATVVHSAHLFGAKKLLYLGSSCIYPRDASQPMKEEALLTGPLEPTNEAYAIAKIAGIKLCQSYRKQYGCDFMSAMPTNLYGTNDNFDLTSSHVLPAMIRKFHDAREEGRNEVTMWGTGTPRREFLHVDDLADACVFLMKNYSDAMHINVGTGEDLSIGELAGDGEAHRPPVGDDRLRSIEAGRLAAKAARRVAAARARLAPPHVARRRHRTHLQLVPRQSRLRARRLPYGLADSTAFRTDFCGTKSSSSSHLIRARPQALLAGDALAPGKQSDHAIDDARSRTGDVERSAAPASHGLLLYRLMREPVLMTQFLRTTKNILSYNVMSIHDCDPQ